MKTANRKLGIRSWSLGAILLLAALPAQAQFELLAVNGGTSTRVTNLYSFGNVSSGASVSQQFQIINTANLPATLTLLSVAGAGFTLIGGPTIPASGLKLNPQGSISFVVAFQASTTGGYSASLNSDGISVFLTANVMPGLTYQIETAAGNQALPSSVDFGSLQVWQTASLTFLVNDATQQALVIPAITVATSDFSLIGGNPSGTTLQPGKQAMFSVEFQPSAAGTRVGTLTIGTSSYYLTGTGTAIPTATPQVTVTLLQSQSAQQGSVAVNFASPAPAGGSGTLTLQFQPLVAGASDPAIAFAPGGQSATFTFAAGDVEATFGSQRSASFQTGTTAGTITFTAQIGGASSQQSVTIAPAAITFSATQASRSQATAQVQVTGFDNSRTAGQLSFTFYDNAGNVLAPGPISADATSSFTQYFAGSAGGNFLLIAVFPVIGDTSVITYFEATFTNSAGKSTTPRTSFQ